MCKHNSFDVPTSAIWKLSLWAVLVSCAFLVILLTGPFSKLLLPPQLSSFGPGNRSSQSNPAEDPSATTGPPSSSNMVWVDTETGIYHRSSGWLADSSHTRRMTESEAIRAGYRSVTTEYHRRF